MGKNKGNIEKRKQLIYKCWDGGLFFLSVSVRCCLGVKKEELYKRNKIMLKPIHQENWKVEY